jgi:hypothetical protein
LESTNPIEVIELLLKYGADVNSTIDNTSSPLSIALESTNPIEVIELLIEKGADVNYRTRYPPATPLSIALKSTNPDDYGNDDDDYKSYHIINLLIEKGAKFKKRDFDIDNASTDNTDSPDVLKLLKVYGALINPVIVPNYTPTCDEKRKEKSLYEVIILLISNGADYPEILVDQTLIKYLQGLNDIIKVAHLLFVKNLIRACGLETELTENLSLKGVLALTRVPHMEDQEKQPNPNWNWKQTEIARDVGIHVDRMFLEKYPDLSEIVKKFDQAIGHPDVPFWFKAAQSSTLLDNLKRPS